MSKEVGAGGRFDNFLDSEIYITQVACYMKIYIKILEDTHQLSNLI